MHPLNHQNNQYRNKTSIFDWFCCAVLTVLLITVLSKDVFAAPHKSKTKTIEPQVNATLVDYLVQEKIHLTKEQEVAKNYQPPSSEDQYTEQKQKYTSLVALYSAKIESLDGFLENQKKQKSRLSQRLKYLQQLPLAKAEATIPERVAKVEALINLNSKNIDLINGNVDLAREIQTQLNENIENLDSWHERFKLDQQLVRIKQQKDKLKKQLSAVYQPQSLSTKSKPVNTSEISHEANLLINNQYVAFIHYQMDDLMIQKQIIKTKILLLKNENTKTLQAVVDVYNDSISQYTRLDHSYQQMLTFIESESVLSLESHLKKSITGLKSALKTELENNKEHKKQLFQELNAYQLELKKLISARQSLAEYNINSWPIIVKKISNIPSLFYKHIHALSLKVYDSFLWLNTFQLSILAGIFIVLSGLSYALRRLIRAGTGNKERTSLSGHLYDGALALVERNIPYLGFMAMLFSVFYMTNIAYAQYQLVMNLLAVWLIFRIFILIARLSLLERISDSSGKDVKLYYRLKWLLLFGGWTTALMTISHFLPLSMILQDLFNRLFMLFILTISLVAWRSKDVIQYLLRPLLKGKKRYLKNAILSVVVLIPITLLTTAVIGLLGFINLAWTMSTYQAYIVVVLAGYILARGVVFDALDVFSEWMISSLNNGWLWIEVFLKPMDKILRIALVLFSIAVLFQCFGWYSDSFVVMGLERLIHSSVVNIPGIHITVASILEFCILVSVFAWASKWTRELCFRWLFLNTKDAGIRNSLSVFTQYSVILLGGLIALRMLGLDFSGMSMILGGLAVGMGFGLRDFASNIVGGIMLLIERPVREGDLISIGEFEGQVSHIGIRSMRVSSWDNTEVLIPNAETFNKPFTNWTHQDGIVRTVIPIKVSRTDDPVMIQQLILDVLAIIPEIVPEPPAQVFLKKIDTALIEFEARYFVNVQTHNRVEVRSQVLFAITAQFKAAGIQPPIEPITVELKEAQGELLSKPRITAD